MSPAPPANAVAGGAAQLVAQYDGQLVTESDIALQPSELQQHQSLARVERGTTAALATSMGDGNRPAASVRAAPAPLACRCSQAATRRCSRCGYSFPYRRRTLQSLAAEAADRAAGGALVAGPEDSRSQPEVLEDVRTRR